MLPYLAWLAFANALNYSIIQKNGNMVRSPSCTRKASVRRHWLLHSCKSSWSCPAVQHGKARFNSSKR